MNPKNILAINIPADGLFLAILRKANGDLSAENCSRIIRDYIDRHLEAKPDMILLNVCYRRCLTPSEVFDSYLYNVETDENGCAVKDAAGTTIKTLSPTTDKVSKYFASFITCARVLLESGIDIYQIAVEQIKKAGCQVYLSLRMNDVHFTGDPAINSGFATKNGGQHTVGRDGVSLDFTQKAVQNHFCQYIDELLRTYPVDGIELDWLRGPGCLPEDRRSDFSVLNTYMQRVRKQLDSFDKTLHLAVRVLATEQENLRNGVDVCQWIADGSIDMVTVENFYIPTNFEMPISQWRASIQKKNTAQRPYCLLCGSDWAVSCVRNYNLAMTPALVRGFACECISSGADGVYLFNFFEEDDTSSYELVTDGNRASLKNCFSERMKAAKEPYGLPRRWVHMDASKERYPICLAPTETYQFSHQPKKPFGTCRLTVGCDEDVALSVLVNDSSVPLQNEPLFPEFAYIPPTQIGKGNSFIYAVSQAAPCVKSAVLPEKEQLLEITVCNISAQTVNILWLELSFE